MFIKKRTVKILAIFLLLVMVLGLCSCGSSDENKALKRVQIYMDAFEKHNQTVQMECMDPELQKLSKGFTDSVAGFFGIQDGYDMGNAAGSFLGEALDDIVGYEVKYKFEKVYQSELKENKGRITPQYKLTVVSKEDSSLNVSMSIIIPFDMIKRGNDWYISVIGESEIIVDENGNEIVPPKIRIANGYPFSDGVAWVQKQGESSVVCIDKEGNELFNGATVIEGGINKFEKFHAGHCFVNENYVVDKEGNITVSPEKQGFDKVEKYFDDVGLIVVSKKIDTVEHSAILYGVIDITGKYIFELSENTNLKVVVNNSSSYLNNGFFQFTNDLNKESSILNMKTGETFEIKPLISGQMEREVRTISIISNINSNGDFIIEVVGREIFDVYYYNDVKEYFKVNANNKSAMKISAQIEKVMECFDTAMLVQSDKEQQKTMLLDFSGNVITEFGDQKIGVVSSKDNKILIDITNDGGIKFKTLVDLSTGSQMFEPVKESVSYSEGCIIFPDKVTDESGKKLFSFDKIDGSITSFSDGVAFVNTGDGKSYYIDKNGERLF